MRLDLRREAATEHDSKDKSRLLPLGWYRVVISDFQERTTKNGKKRLCFTTLIEYPEEYAGRKLSVELPGDPDTIKHTLPMLQAVYPGHDFLREPIDFEWVDLIGEVVGFEAQKYETGSRGGKWPDIAPWDVYPISDERVPGPATRQTYSPPGGGSPGIGAPPEPEDPGDLGEPEDPGDPGEWDMTPPPPGADKISAPPE